MLKIKNSLGDLRDTYKKQVHINNKYKHTI